MRRRRRQEHAFVDLERGHRVSYRMSIPRSSTVRYNHSTEAPNEAQRNGNLRAAMRATSSSPFGVYCAAQECPRGQQYGVKPERAVVFIREARMRAVGVKHFEQPVDVILPVLRPLVKKYRPAAPQSPA